MRHRVRQQQKEWLPLVRVLLDELRRLGGVTIGDRVDRDIVIRDLVAAHHVHRRHVVGVETAVVIIEPMPVRIGLRRIAEVPFADAACRVALRLEQRGDRLLRGGKLEPVSNPAALAELAA